MVPQRHVDAERKLVHDENSENEVKAPQCNESSSSARRGSFAPLKNTSQTDEHDGIMRA